MRATNRKRALLVSGAVILLCMTVIVGMTWALFTDVKRVNNHLQAGDLKLTLERIGLQKTSLDAKGYLDTVTYTTEQIYADFSAETNENVFDIKSGEKIVPGSEYTATMKISNLDKNSDVAFGYWIEVVYTGSANIDLAGQLKVSVNNGEGKVLNAEGGLKVGSDDAPIGVIGLDESTEFTVNVLFEKLSNTENNKAKGDTVTFDLVVHAIQYTGQAPTPTP